MLRYHGHDAASKYYQSLSDPLFLAKNSIYLIQTSLGDGILVCASRRLSLFSSLMPDTYVLALAMLYRMWQKLARHRRSCFVYPADDEYAHPLFLSRRVFYD